MPLRFRALSSRVFKPAVKCFTLVMMLSRQDSRSSMGTSLRALFLVEDLEKRPMTPLDEKALKDDQKGPLIESYDKRGIWHSRNIADVLVMNQSNEKSLTMNLSQGDLSLDDIKDRVFLGESSKDTMSVSEYKDTVSMSETLPDTLEGETTKDYISETEMNKDSNSEAGTVKSLVDNELLEDDEIISLKKECCPFGTQPLYAYRLQVTEMCWL